jgi:hypothetical protein
MILFVSWRSIQTSGPSCGGYFFPRTCSTYHALCRSWRPLNTVEEAIARLTERMERGFTEAATKCRELRQDLTRLEGGMDHSFVKAAAERRDMRREIGQLKGLGQEQFYRDRAAAIFGRLLRQGYDATN